MGTVNQCLLSVKEALPEQVKSNASLKNMLEQIEQLKETTKTPGEFQEASAVLVKEFQKNASDARIQKVENEIKYRKIAKDLEDPNLRKFAANNPDKYMRSIVASTTETFKGAGTSIELEAAAIQGKLMSILNQGLEPVDWKSLGKGTHDLDIFRYIIDGATDVTPSAKRIGDLLVQVDNVGHKEKALSGSMVQQLRRRVIKRTHDASKMSRLGREAWKTKIKEYTIKKPIDDKVLNEMYDDIIMGTYEKNLQREMMGVDRAQGSGNIDTSKSRVIVFDDGVSEAKYHSEFGEGTLLDGVMSNINSAGREAATYNKLGTNPIETWNRVGEDVAKLVTVESEKKIKEAIDSGLKGKELEKVTSKALKKRDQLKARQGNLNNLFDRAVFGPKASNSTIATVGSYARQLVGLSKLGKVLLSGGIGDFATTAATKAASSGDTLLNSLFDTVTETFKNISPSQRKALGSDMLMYFGSASGQVQSRFASGEKVSGFVGALSDVFYKMTGITDQTEIFKLSNASLISKDLASTANLAYDALTPHRQAELARFEIDATDWDILRKQGIQSIDGANGKFITAKSIEEADIKSPIKGVSNTKYKRDLAVRLNEMYHEAANRGSPTGGIAEDVFFEGSTDPNTYMGQLARMVGQFKKVMFVSQDVVKRSGLSGDRAANMGLMEALGAKGIRGNVMANMAGTAGLMTGFGYMIKVAKDLEKGRTPSDPTDPAVWADSMLLGGSAGLMGDFIAGEYNKRYKNIASDIIGPVLGGTAADITEVFAGWVRGEDVSSKAARKLLNNTPFGNMIILRTALDAAFLNDMAGPAYMRRKKQALKESNQELFIGD